MQATSEIITDVGSPFVETNCKIDVDGHTFESGGSWLLRRKKDNLLEGVFYMHREKCPEHPADNIYYVGTWDGQKRVSCIVTNYWHSNMGDERASVYFTWDGIKFHGIWFKTNSDIVRARQLKSD